MPISLWSTVDSQPAMPGCVSQIFSSSSRGTADDRGDPWNTFGDHAWHFIRLLFQGLQITADTLELGSRNVHHRHVHAGFDRLRIGDPSRESCRSYVGRVTAASVARLSMCVRSGATLPPALLPRTV